MLRSVAYACFIAGPLLFGPAAMAQDSAGGEAPLLQDLRGECAEPLAFNHVLTGEPLTAFRPDEAITPAVAEFHCSGENAYSGDEQAIGEGEDLYRLCAGCHMPDGTGRMGPNLVDDNIKYERVATAHGEFEVIYGGAAGAMQPMGRHFDQDEILKIMAYIETLGAN